MTDESGGGTGAGGERHPYRKERDIIAVIPPDHRMRNLFVLVASSSAISAVVASLVTLAVIRTADRRESFAVPFAPPGAGIAAPIVTARAVDSTASLASCTIAPGMDPNRGPAVLPFIPRYTGAPLRSSYDVGAGTANVTLETCDSVDDVVAFYRSVKSIDSDGERETTRGRDFFFSRPATARVEVYRVSVSSEHGITRIVIGEGTPRQLTSDRARRPAPLATPVLPQRAPAGGLGDRF